MLSEQSLDIVARSMMRKMKGEPAWLEEYRPHQVIAIKEILDAFTHCPVVVLDAPTGSGKTLIAETVRRFLGERGLYVTPTIALQEQFERDYPYAVRLMGRSNYEPSGNFPVGATCADCRKPKCGYCDSVGECPYECRKHDALAADIAVLNTSYLLTEGNGPGRFRGRGLIVLDEADTLESELMRYVGVEITRGRSARYGLREPERVTVADSWREWFDRSIPQLSSRRSKIQGDDLRSQRERDYLTRLLAQLRSVERDLDEGWVYTGKNGTIAFKPVSVEKWGSALWSLGHRFLLMSATVISPGALLNDLGYTGGGYAAVNVGSTFPPTNRPVIVRPVQKVTKKNDELTNIVRALGQIARDNSDKRVLVHCVSYNLAGRLYGELAGSCEAIGMGCGTYSRSDEKSQAIAEFGRYRGYMLFAPSMDRGVDLPDDLCRVIVIAKVPYPYLGDRQVSARLHGRGGQTWYIIQAVRSIVQMTGRGVRHEEDHCSSYILDTQFLDVWNKARGLFPKWWTDALKWER